MPSPLPSLAKSQPGAPAGTCWGYLQQRAPTTPAGSPTGHWDGPQGGEQLGGCGQEAGCLPTCTLPLVLMHSLSAPKTSVTRSVGSQGGRRSVAFHLCGAVSPAFPLTQAEGSRLHLAQCTLSGSHTCPRPVLGAGETDETRLSLCP